MYYNTYFLTEEIPSMGSSSALLNKYFGKQTISAFSIHLIH